MSNDSNQGQNSRNVTARILLIETEKQICEQVEKCLASLGTVKSLASSPLIFEKTRLFQPHIIILSLDLADANASVMCRRIKENPDSNCRIILLSSRKTKLQTRKDLSDIANGQATKPLDESEFVSLITHFLMESKLMPRSIAAESSSQSSEQETSDFLVQEQRLLDALRMITETHDHSKGHLFRVGLYSRTIAQQLQTDSEYSAQVDSVFLANLPSASQLHDIGNVGIDQRVLKKARRLTETEFAEVQKHTEIGFYLLDEMLQVIPESETFRMARDIALSHHEYWNGKGYPYGMKGEEIPLEARIVAVTDVFDALTSKRTFRDAHKPSWARDLINSQAGQQFDPVVIKAFNEVFTDLEAHCTTMIEETKAASVSKDEARSSRIQDLDFASTSTKDSQKSAEEHLNELCETMNHALAKGEHAQLLVHAANIEMETERLGEVESADLANELLALIDRKESIAVIAGQLDCLQESINKVSC